MIVWSSQYDPFSIFKQKSAFSGTYSFITSLGGGGGVLRSGSDGGCAAEAAKPVPIFKGHFGGKGYPLLGIFRQNHTPYLGIFLRKSHPFEWRVPPPPPPTGYRPHHISYFSPYLGGKTPFLGST